MKNLKIIFVVLFSIALMGFQGSSDSPVPCLACKCKKVVAEGCVGECGSTAKIVYVVDNPNSSSVLVNLCLLNAKSSLCPNTGAIAVIYVNNTAIKKVDITKVGSGTTFTAKNKDVVTVVVSTYPINNGIICVRLGELIFDLMI